MSRTLSFLLFSIFLFIWSCGPNIVTSESQSFGESGWPYQDTLHVKLDIQDTSKIYNLFLDIQHSIEFSYQNFYVNIYTSFPDGQRIKELVSLELMDEQSIWLGDCNTNSCTLRIPIQQGAFFNQLGPHQITIEQYSRQNPLPGIEQVAFLLEDTGLSK